MNRCRVKKGLALLALVFVVTSAESTVASQWNERILLLGHDGSAWYPYIAQLEGDRIGDWRKIRQVVNPTEITYNPSLRTLFYKNDRGDLRSWDRNSDSSRAIHYCSRQDPPAYSQLRAHAEGLALVELAGGKSRETSLVLFDPRELFSEPQESCTHPSGDRPVHQSSAQFHPLVAGRFVYYAHVACRRVCDPIVQDVWRFDRVTAHSAQLTRLNATTYLHSVDQDYGYLSSNAHGYYHLARVNLDTGQLAWLTEGQVTDSHPSISRGGHVFFLRRSGLESHLMRLETRGDQSSKPVPVAIPSDIRKIRYLEVTGHE